MSFAGILKSEKLPVVLNYNSFFFIKIFFFILTKFLIQAYIFSIAIKSLMWFVILPVKELKPIFQYYYRGICRPDYYQPRFNHGSWIMDDSKCRVEAEVLTFNQATLIFPLVYLALLLLPTVLYASMICFQHLRKHRRKLNIIDMMVMSIFAIITNISFLNTGQKKVVFKRRTQSLPNLCQDSEQTNLIQRSKSVEHLKRCAPGETEDMYRIEDSNFSRFQSNLLYALFFLGSLIFFCMDLGYQRVRNGAFTNTTLFFFGCFLMNIILWMDFNFQLLKKQKSKKAEGIFMKLLDDSTDLLVCALIAPLFWISSRGRKKVHVKEEVSETGLTAVDSKIMVPVERNEIELMPKSKSTMVAIEI